LAQEKFEQARAYWEAGNSQAAEPLFLESYELERSIGALLGWARCLEEQQRFQSAWEAYQEAIQYALELGQPAREKYARERASAVDVQRSRIKMQLSAELLVVDELTVQAGGKVVPVGGIAQHEIPVDGGPVKLLVSAPGYQPWSAVVEVAVQEGRSDVLVPPLEPIVVAAQNHAKPRVAPRTQEVGKSEALVKDRSAHARGSNPTVSTERWLALGAGAIGIGSAIGAAIKWQDWKDAERIAGPYCSDYCDSDYYTNIHNDGADSKHFAIGLGVGSLVFLAAGVGLFLWPFEEEAAVEAKITSNGMTLSGQF
jgi:hypothetical protein